MESQSMERIVPDLLEDDENTGKDTLELHIERYKFASKHLKPGKVLDIACGVGYGTYIIGQNANCDGVIGVDISEDSVKYARSRYMGSKISYECHDALTYKNDTKFDTIVSLETIEHVPDPNLLISHLSELLKQGGHFIGSVPTTPSVDANPHHLTDFTPKSIRKIFEQNGFAEIKSFVQIQKFSLSSILLRKEKRTEGMRKNLLKYYLLNPFALYKRLWTTLRYGFSNRYLTTVWEFKN